MLAKQSEQGGHERTKNEKRDGLNMKTTVETAFAMHARRVPLTGWRSRPVRGATSGTRGAPERHDRATRHCGKVGEAVAISSAGFLLWRDAGDRDGQLIMNGVGQLGIMYVAPRRTASYAWRFFHWEKHWPGAR